MIGKHPVRLDDKNRIFVPAKLRDELGETFFVTIGVNGGHRCLTAYTSADWQELSNRYNALPLSSRSGAQSLIFMHAVCCTPDKQNRFTLSHFLLDYAGITSDAVMAGRAGQAEIWNAEEFRAFEEENMTPEKLLASLEAIGL